MDKDLKIKEYKLSELLDTINNARKLNGDRQIDEEQLIDKLMQFYTAVGKNSINMIEAFKSLGNFENTSVDVKKIGLLLSARLEILRDLKNFWNTFIKEFSVENHLTLEIQTKEEMESVNGHPVYDGEYKQYIKNIIFSNIEGIVLFLFFMYVIHKNQPSVSQTQLTLESLPNYYDEAIERSKILSVVKDYNKALFNILLSTASKTLTRGQPYQIYHYSLLACIYKACCVEDGSYNRELNKYIGTLKDGHTGAVKVDEEMQECIDDIRNCFSEGSQGRKMLSICAQNMPEFSKNNLSAQSIIDVWDNAEFLLKIFKHQRIFISGHYAPNYKSWLGKRYSEHSEEPLGISIEKNDQNLGELKVRSALNTLFYSVIPLLVLANTHNNGKELRTSNDTEAQYSGNLETFDLSSLNYLHARFSESLNNTLCSKIMGVTT